MSSRRNNGGSARFSRIACFFLLTAAADYNAVLSFTAVQSSPTLSTRYYKNTYVNVKFNSLKSRSIMSKHNQLFEFDSETTSFDFGDLCNTPREAPTTYPFEKDKFYVRECYPQYYDLLMERFADKERNYHCITVTGTPGIGKSIFYLYFLMRYRHENPGKNVVTASFTDERELTECVLFQDNGEIVGPEAIPRPKTLVRKDGLDCEFYLYDGPPKFNLRGAKTICFSCQNELWLNSMRKSEYHRAIYMPSWTLEELHDANESLGLNIEKAELDTRFETFGGSARYCLTTYQDFVDAGRKAIDVALDKMKTFSDVQNLFEGNEQNTDIVHLLMNYIPDEENPSMFTLKPASFVINNKLRSVVRKQWSQM